MGQEELVSVITPVYNAEKYLEQAIQSVLQQTYSNWEMILVDDKSIDGSRGLIDKYAKNDSRFILISLASNSGPAIARNIGIKIARGRYIAFLDSDDLWLPSKLKRQITEMENRGALVSCSSFFTINSDSSRTGLRAVPKVIFYKNLLLNNYIGNLTGVFDVNKLGKHQFHEVKAEDYLFWLEILQKTNWAIGLREPLAEYRVYSESISANKVKSGQWTWDIYRRNLKFSVMKAFFYFFFNRINAVLKRVFAAARYRRYIKSNDSLE